MRELWTTIPTLAWAFHEVVCGTGLQLNLRKCVFMPLWRYQHSQVKRLILEHAPSWKAMIIAWTARYVGIMFGPASGDTSWEMASEKCVQCASQSAALANGNFFALLSFKASAHRVLLFVSQLHPPTKHDATKYKLAVAKAHGSPMWWMPHAVAVCCKDSGVGSIDVPDIEIHAQATMMRTILTLGVDVQYCKRIWELSRNHHIWLRDRITNWKHKHIITDAVHCVEHMTSLGWMTAGGQVNDPELSSCILDTPKKLQSVLVTRLASQRNLISNAEQALEVRFKRWQAHDIPPDTALRKFRAVCAILIRHSPPRVLHAAHRMWLFAWNTDARMHHFLSRRCVFCRQGSGDGQYHYLTCSKIIQNYWLTIPNVIYFSSWNMAYALTGDGSRSVHWHFTFMCACMKSIHLLRNGVLEDIGVDNVTYIKQMFNQAMRAQTLSSKTKKRVKNKSAHPPIAYPAQLKAGGQLSTHQHISPIASMLDARSAMLIKPSRG